MIDAVSHHSLLARVREYLSHHPSRRRREEPAPVDDAQLRRSIASDVHAYVLALEQVVSGEAVHRGRLLETRGRYDRAMRTISQVPRRTAALGDYEAAVTMYVHALRVQLDAGGVQRQVMDEMREFYEVKTAALEDQR
jgi:hypothetical protein